MDTKASRAGRAVTAVVVTLAGLIAVGCGKMQVDAPDRRLDLVKAALKDPASAQFKNVRDVDGVLCGFVNATNSYGGYVGFKAFYIEKGVVEIEKDRTSDLDASATVFDWHFSSKCR